MWQNINGELHYIGTYDQFKILNQRKFELGYLNNLSMEKKILSQFIVH
jgi:hypothetical protein